MALDIGFEKWHPASAARADGAAHARHGKPRSKAKKGVVVIIEATVAAIGSRKQLMADTW